MITLALLIRALVTLGLLGLFLRMAGRDGIKAHGPLNLIVALLLGKLAESLVLSRVSLPEGMVALGLLVWVHLFGMLVLRKSAWLRSRVGVVPRMLVRNGRIDVGATQRERLSDVQLHSLLRESGVTRLGDIRELWIEPDDAISVLRTPATQPVNHADLRNDDTRQGEDTSWRHAA